MKKKTLAILSIVAILLVVAILVLVIAVNKSRDVDDPAEPTAKPTVAPIVEKPTSEPTVEPTAEPTPEPTADPVETLTALRDEAIAEQDAIEEVMQAQIDLVAPLLEVVKTLPNFEETPVYTSVSWSGAELETAFSEDDINSVLTSYNYFIYTVNQLIATYPELTETEEFQNLLEAPTFNTIMYDLKVNTYNGTLANTTTSEFEELPNCIIDASSIEY